MCLLTLSCKNIGYDCTAMAMQSIVIRFYGFVCRSVSKVYE